jgi:putative addiction module killer protein
VACHRVIERLQWEVFTILRMPEFDAWLEGLRDKQTKVRLVARLRKAQLGNLGDVKAVGGEVYEMREHFGPGWRMYFARRGDVLVIMLGGGDKSSQTKDIAKACELAARLED